MSYSYIQNPVTGQILHLHDREAIQVLKRYVKTFQQHLRVQQGGFNYGKLEPKIRQHEGAFKSRAYDGTTEIKNMEITASNWSRQAKNRYLSNRKDIRNKAGLFMEASQESYNKNAYGAAYSDSSKMVLLRLPCKVKQVRTVHGTEFKPSFPFQLKQMDRGFINYVLASLSNFVTDNPDAGATWYDDNPLVNLTFHYYALELQPQSNYKVSSIFKTVDNESEDPDSVTTEPPTQESKTSEPKIEDSGLREQADEEEDALPPRVEKEEAEFNWVVNFSMGSTTSQVFIVKQNADRGKEVTKVFLCGDHPVGAMDKNKAAFTENMGKLWKKITQYLEDEINKEDQVLVKFYNSIGYAFGPDRKEPKYTKEGEVLKPTSAYIIKLPIEEDNEGKNVFKELNTFLTNNKQANMTVGLISKVHSEVDKAGYDALLGPDASWAKHILENNESGLEYVVDCGGGSATIHYKSEGKKEHKVKNLTCNAQFFSENNEDLNSTNMAKFILGNLKGEIGSDKTKLSNRVFPALQKLTGVFIQTGKARGYYMAGEGQANREKFEQEVFTALRRGDYRDSRLTFSWTRNMKEH